MRPPSPRCGIAAPAATTAEPDSSPAATAHAQPGGTAAFCIKASAIATNARTVPPAGFETFAVATLGELEEPFTEFYDAFTAWRLAAAAWDSQWRATPVPPAAAIFVPTTTVAPAIAGPALQPAPAATSVPAPPAPAGQR